MSAYHDNDDIENRIHDALRYIPADDRETWVRIGMAIHAGMGNDGYAIWDDWSRTAGNYNERASRDVWRSIRPNGGVSIGTLFHIAHQHGYRAGTEPPTRPAAARRPPPPPRRETSAYAAELWLRADTLDTVVADHAYARAKGIAHAGGAGCTTASGRIIGQDADCIIVPIRDTGTGKVQGVQAISSSGAKQTFGRVAGGSHIIGNTLDLHIPWTVAEGWASAYSWVFHHHRGHGVCAVAFGRGNQDTVAQALADRYAPDEIVILREVDA